MTSLYFLNIWQYSDQVWTPSNAHIVNVILVSKIRFERKGEEGEDRNEQRLERNGRIYRVPGILSAAKIFPPSSRI